ncbi:MAG: hypothetical protein IJU94_07055 [Clostridia bacterium]|nr:hypothetical protein [Clostridia bacterium]
MRVISACGNGSEDVIGGISAGLRRAGVAHCAVSESGRGTLPRGRLGDGYAIDAAGDVREDARVLLVSADRLPFLRGFSEAVLILCPAAPAEAADFDGKAYVITDGEREVPPALKRFPLISCGMGVKNTVTFSSVAGDGGMICLQRKLNTFSGKVAEPQEYRFRSFCADAFASLAAFTALLICDCFNDG